jgi:hypothetical protein
MFAAAGVEIISMTTPLKLSQRLLLIKLATVCHHPDIDVEILSKLTNKLLREASFLSKYFRNR